MNDEIGPHSGTPYRLPQPIPPRQLSGRYHMGLCVRGALKNWTKRDYRNAMKWMTQDGSRFLSPEGVKEALLDELSQGHEFIPYGECDNWDWKSGCLGHAIESNGA
jgi:hypothetical protein